MNAKSLIFVASVAATAAFAHSGVQNPEVMARMNLMTEIADDMKALGSIAKGETEFDAEIVEQRADSLADHARRIITLFEIEAEDPKSESREEIWTDWAGFSDATSQMEKAALALGGVRSEDGFTDAFRALGQSCTACHKDYRIKVD